jgi:hypothetical protein
MTSMSRSQDILRLSIPFYRQASQFTCGPACLMMVMKFFQPELHLDRELEFDIWREANLVESYGTSKEGLALAAARRGFDAYTMGATLRYSYVSSIASKIPNIDFKMLELLYTDTKTKFRAIGLKNAGSQVAFSMLKRLLQKSHIPILLTSTKLFGEKEGLPHWVVISGYGACYWYLNNPLGRSPNTRIGYTELKNNLGYRTIRCAVIVRGLRSMPNRKATGVLAR